MNKAPFSTPDYNARQDYRRATGQKAMSQSGMHPDMDPLGVRIRESRDSAECPDSKPLACLFDVTASMGEVPRRLQAKLPLLPRTLLLSGVADVQVNFGAIGDEHTDYGPLQIGQFETDVRMDDFINKIWLELGGGGNGGESYGLALYWVARHTVCDRWEKRKQKGHLFLTGDECPHRVVTAAAIHRFVGDRVGDQRIEDLVREVQEKWNLTFLHVDTEMGRRQGSLDVWRRLLPERVVSLPDPETVCETIATIVARSEGVDAARVAESLLASGADPAGVKAAADASAALALRPTGGGATGRASGRLPGAPSGPVPFPGAERL